MNSFARMTAAMFELPFRVLELPFMTLAILMDSILSDGDTKANARKQGGSTHRQGAARRVSRVKVVQQQRHAA